MKFWKRNNWWFIVVSLEFTPSGSNTKSVGSTTLSISESDPLRRYTAATNTVTAAMRDAGVDVKDGKAIVVAYYETKLPKPPK